MSLKISMILCTCNEAIDIKNTISELEKNIQNLELVIVDDNSTDGTKEIINQINYDNRIKIIFREKSKGLDPVKQKAVTAYEKKTGKPHPHKNK